MIEAPDVFTFRTQLVAGLPEDIIAFILDKAVPWRRALWMKYSISPMRRKKLEK
jgi:hypothetical protein